MFDQSPAARSRTLASLLVLTPILIMLSLLLAACASSARNEVLRLPTTLRGRVTGPNGPVANALVQLQSTTTRATSAADGSFELHGEGLGSAAITVTAWAQDHFIGFVRLDQSAVAAN